MRPWTIPTMTLALALSAAAARGDPTTQPAGAAVGGIALAAVDVSHLPLEVALSNVKGRVPAFRYVVFRKAGVPRDYPVLPAMSVEGVSIDQFLSLVMDECPGVTVKLFDHDGPNQVYEVNVRPTPDQYRTTLQPGEGVRPGATPPASADVAQLGPGIVYHPAPGESSASRPLPSAPVSQAPAAPPPTDVPVHVYRLSDIVDLLAMQKVYPQGRIVNGLADAGLPPAAVAKAHDAVAAADKQAVADVLSLLQAALRASGDDHVSLEVHEPTQTLIFQGDAQAQAVLEETLKTLRPTDQEFQEIAAWRGAANTGAEADLLNETVGSPVMVKNQALRDQVDALRKQLAGAR